MDEAISVTPGTDIAQGAGHLWITFFTLFLLIIEKEHWLAKGIPACSQHFKVGRYEDVQEWQWAMELLGSWKNATWKCPQF